MQNSIQIDIPKENKNDLLIDIITTEKIINNIFDCLSFSDIINFIKLNKNIYSIFTGKDYNIYKKYLLKKYNGSYLFLINRKTELKQINNIINSIKYSDEIHKKYYQIIHIFSIIFYSLSFFLGLVVFPLLFVLRSKLSSGGKFVQAPLVIIWAIGLIMLIIDRIFCYIINKKISKYIDKTINNIKEDPNKKRKLMDNLTRRMYSQKPRGFIPICFTYITFYTPLYFNIVFKVNYDVLFRITACMITGIYYVYDLSMFLYYKFKNKNTKLDIYEKVFANSENKEDIEYFKKMKESIINQTTTSDVGDKILGILYYFVKFISLFMIIWYINSFLKKIKNENYDIDWAVLLIPIDVIGGFVILYMLVFIYSIKSVKIEGKKKIYISSALILISSIVILFIANFISRMSSYFLIAINFIMIVSSISYYIYLRKIEEKFEECDEEN